MGNSELLFGAFEFEEEAIEKFLYGEGFGTDDLLYFLGAEAYSHFF